MTTAELLNQPMSLVLIVALLGLVPLLAMALTAFVKISTVLHITRSAIGAPSVPSNAVILALSAALTLIAMAPVGARISARLLPAVEQPAPNATQLIVNLATAVREPMRDFLSANASASEKSRFLKLAKESAGDPALIGADDLSVIIPAFIVSELIAAFALGFAIYLPFLVIDLVVSNVLLSLGMSMMNPVQISLPFKLLLFVASDGWGLLAQNLVSGYSSGG
ncbi:MAG: EscR/YscR/HrcR family type III secretion system export apparatus protein [Polyangiaceae bacterium]|nr:EscR/YscR/HrcR family type III secretion system export apparatus protein [Polyangiaceae bacterium]